MADIAVTFWYPDIAAGYPATIGQIVEALDYYREVHLDGQKHLDLRGYLGKLLQEQAGLLRLYNDAHTDCSMLWKFMDETIKHEKAKKRLWYQTAEGKEAYGDLKKTDIDAIIQADTDIHNLVCLNMMIELWKNSLGTLVEDLKRRSIILSMIGKVRESGEHEAFIDSSKETNPETLG